MTDLDLFSQHFYYIYGFVDIVTVVLYYIIVVVYLIWIFRVHKDLNRLFLQYPRTPGGALACMIIPFYSLYGLPSTYQFIGSYYQRTPALRKDGQWIQGLSVPLVIFVFASNIVNRFVGKADEVSGSLLFASSLVSFVAYVIFLTLCILVSRGLYAIQVRADDTQLEPLTEQIIVNPEPPISLKS
ncbi:hypothetical protein JOC55_004495 [Paenibacillus sacheonensis]|nr:hypothetical protein [Paenibacillus sacheonensis]